jgi:PAS domain S-box-containing protein
MQTRTTYPISILLVEDDDIARKSLHRILTMKLPGSHIHLAGDGEDGLNLYIEHRPDLVITDISMPAMSGIQLVEKVKALNPHSLIIFLSAHSDTHYLIQAIEMGVTQYVLKPINQHRLFEVIDRCLDRLKLEQQVRSQQEFIRKLSRAVERSPNMVVITTADGTIDYVNPKFIESSGFLQDEVMGRDLRQLLGSGLDKETITGIWRCIKRGEEWHGELQPWQRGGNSRWVAAAISSILDEHGETSHFVLEMADITNRKLAEEKVEILNTHLSERAIELEALNRDLEAYNYMVSHDLRSPLTAISGYSQLLRELYSDRLDEAGVDYLKEIIGESARMSQLIATLLNFSKLSNQELKKQEVDLGNIAAGVAAELQRRNPERMVTFTIASDAFCIGDPHLLRVVLENLMGNAWKYSAKRTTAEIEFGSNGTGDEQAFYVRDNGTGFNMSVADKLFMPFQRMHNGDEFSGHGIGLATVERIIKRHGGRVWAEGEPGKGATFYFTL